jgi:hypothetical protein
MYIFRIADFSTNSFIVPSQGDPQQSEPALDL